MACITVTPKRSRPDIPVSDHSTQASHCQHHLSGTTSRNPIGDSRDASDASKYLDVAPSNLPSNVEAKRTSEMTQPPTDIANGTDEIVDPEANGDTPANEEEVKEALSKPPPVNSDYLPLPWKGRLGYVSNPCCSAFI